MTAESIRKILVEEQSTVGTYFYTLTESKLLFLSVAEIFFFMNLVPLLFLYFYQFIDANIYNRFMISIQRVCLLLPFLRRSDRDCQD